MPTNGSINTPADYITNIERDVRCPRCDARVAVEYVGGITWDGECPEGHGVVIVTAEQFSVELQDEDMEVRPDGLTTQ